MKQVIKLTEQDIQKLVLESIEEINAKPTSRFAKFTGYTPGFRRDNERHMKAYDSFVDWYHYAVNTLKVRPDIINSMLDIIQDDIKLGEL